MYEEIDQLPEDMKAEVIKRVSKGEGWFLSFKKEEILTYIQKERDEKAKAQKENDDAGLATDRLAKIVTEMNDSGVSGGMEIENIIGTAAIANVGPDGTNNTLAVSNVSRRAKWFSGISLIVITICWGSHVYLDRDLGFFSESFQLSLSSEPTEQLIKNHNFSSISGPVASSWPAIKRNDYLVDRVDAMVISFGKAMTTDKVLEYLKLAGMRPANLYELLCLREYSQGMCERLESSELVAIDESYNDIYFMHVRGQSDLTSVGFKRDLVFAKNICFLAVKNVEYRLFKTKVNYKLKFDEALIKSGINCIDSILAVNKDKIEFGRDAEAEIDIFPRPKSGLGLDGFRMATVEELLAFVEQHKEFFTDNVDKKILMCISGGIPVNDSQMVLEWCNQRFCLKSGKTGWDNAGRFVFNSDTSHAYELITHQLLVKEK